VDSENLQEDLSKDAVCLLPEHCGEDDSNSVVRSLDIDSLLVAIMDGHQISLPRSRSFKLLLLFECLLEGRGQRISLQECNGMDESVPLLFTIVSKIDKPSPVENSPPSGGAVSRSMMRLTL
jgi:hypothetical protein